MLRLAIDATVGADASFEAREVAALDLTNEATRLFLQSDLMAIAASHGTQVEVDGVIYQRHAPGTVRYFTLCGALDLERWTYRAIGRNGPTIVPMDLEAGWLSARHRRSFRIALGYAKDHMRSGEEDMTADHRCPPSRSTLERVPRPWGPRPSRWRPASNRACGVRNVFRKVPSPSRWARTAVPMEEDVPAGETPATRRKTRNRPYERKKPAPVHVNYRMAYRDRQLPRR